MRFLFIAVMIFGGVSLSAQDVPINEDNEVTQLMRIFKQINNRSEYVEGWRVQVVSTTDRQRMESVREALRERYPYLSTSWEHDRPYYRLRAGAYATRLEALQLQHMLREFYPGCIPTRDTKMSASEIIGY
jgi:hypothetical protein